MNKEVKLRPPVKITKREKDRLNWLINFINADLDAMPYGDILGLAFECYVFCEGSQDMKTEAKDMGWLWEGEKAEFMPFETLKEYQTTGDTLLIMLHARATAMGYSSMSDKVRKEPIRAKKTRKIGKNDFEPSNSVDFDMVNIKFVTVPVITTDSSRTVARVSLEKESIHKSGKYMVSAQDFRHSFFESLHNINLFDIRRCDREDCHKYFYRATAKEKNYCSNKCIWVVNSSKRRARDREAENERRLGQYKKKVKKTHPKAKVTRRKRGGK